MGKVIAAFGFFLLIFVFTEPTSVNAQASGGYFTCQWNGSTDTCQIGTETCNEAAGETAAIELCSPLLNETACNASGYLCISETGDPAPDTTNKYTCEWDSARSTCILDLPHNCSPGFEPGGGCSSVAPGNCNSSTLLNCVLSVTDDDPSPPAGGGDTECNPNGTTAEKLKCGCGEGYISTAIGCIPLTDIEGITEFFLTWAIGIAGGIAILLIGFAAYRIITSQGDPRRLQGGQELLLSAIGGLIMVVLSIYLLRFIGVDLLGLF